MNANQLNIEQADVNKLLCAGNGDAALLYLYIRSGNHPDQAGNALNFNDLRIGLATATLRQLGLWPQDRVKPILAGERPRYTETDVIRAKDTDIEFRPLCDEVEHQLGKALTVEETKILLSFVRYLGMSAEVIVMLVCHCKMRAAQKGNRRPPSLRTIEKEAYVWAERGIETIEDAVAYTKQINLRYSKLGRLKEVLQIRGRNLTPGEEKYANQWLEWGFGEEALSMAYERTCLNTGGLSWAYMHKILTRWQSQGLLTPEQIRAGDQKKNAKSTPRTLDDDEKAALAALIQEG